MTLLTHLLPGILLGVALNRCGLCGYGRIRRMLRFRDAQPLRCVMAAVGFGMIFGALLMWLAVIDVDEVRVLPLHGGTIIGGVIAGAALGITGVTPGVSLAAIGSGNAVYGLCGLLGCVAGTAVFRLLHSVAEPVRAVLPASESTLFATTLDHPFVLGGGFAGLACLGAAVLTVSLLLPRTRTHDAEPAPITPPVANVPETLPEETFIASLPEEEPIVIDVAAEEIPEPAADDALSDEEEPPEDNSDDLRELAMLDDGEDPL